MKLIKLLLKITLIVCFCFIASIALLATIFGDGDLGLIEILTY